MPISELVHSFNFFVCCTICSRMRPAPSSLLLPPSELVQQVYRVAKALSGAGLRFRSACMTGGHEDRDDRSKSWRTQVREGGRGQGCDPLCM